MAPSDQFDVNEFVRRVLGEDMGSGGDITSAATIAPEARFIAEMNCRQPIVVAGLEIAARSRGLLLLWLCLRLRLRGGRAR